MNKKIILALSLFNVMLVFSQQDSLKTHRDEENTKTLQSIELIGRARKDYNSNYSFSASKIALKNIEVAQSISTVTKEFLADRQIFRVGDAVTNVSGVNITGYYSQYAIRGITQGWGNRDNNRHINGMPAFVGFTSQPISVNLERIEVIKGPASMTFSSANAGGSINMVTKKPLDEARHEIGFSIGSYNTIRSTFDFTGPINQSKSLLYRLNVGYENAASYRDLLTRKTYIIAPTLSYVFSDKTRVNLELVINHNNSKLDRGQPIFGVKKGEKADLGSTPINFAIGASNDYQKGLNVMLMGNLSHHFTDDFTFNMAYMKYIWDEDLLEHRTDNQFARAIDRKTIPTKVQMRVSRREQTLYSNNFAAYFNKNLNIGELKNKMVFGYDLTSFEVNQTGGWNQARGYRLSDGTVVNSYNPKGVDAITGIPYVEKKDATGATYRVPFVMENGQPKPNVPHFDLENPKYYLANLNDYIFNKEGIKPLSYTTNSVYFMNNMEFRKFILSIGLRQEWYTDKDFYKQPKEKITKQNKFLKRLGLIYKATDNINLYGAYVEGFEVQTNAYLGSSNYGGPFAPLSSKMLEGGVKTEWFKGRLQANVAYFNIHQKNVLTDDPNDNNQLKVQGASERSQGIEIDITGSILPNWQVLTNYAFTDAFLTEKSEKYRKENTPRHNFNLWSRYDIKEGALRNFGIGLGVKYSSEKMAWLDRSLIVPSYTVADISLYYRLKGIQLALNVNNIFNKKYWLGAYNYTRLFPAAPRNVMLNVKYTF